MLIHSLPPNCTLSRNIITMYDLRLHQNYLKIYVSSISIPDHTRLGHWILDGDLAHSHLLRFALKESNFTDTTVLLCVAMTTPWNIMDQLHNWATLLHDHIDKLTLSAEETKRLQNESKLFLLFNNQNKRAVASRLTSAKRWIHSMNKSI